MAAGRNSKLTPERIKKVAALVREGNYARQAAAASGIGESTYYLWLQQGREAQAKTGTLTAHEKRAVEFLEAIKSAEAAAEAEALSVIQGAGRDGTWQAAAWYLERKHADRWGRKDSHKVEAQVKADVSVGAKTREELEVEIQSLDPVEE
jgi:hypothetical protein